MAHIDEQDVEDLTAMDAMDDYDGPVTEADIVEALQLEMQDMDEQERMFVTQMIMEEFNQAQAETDLGPAAITDQLREIGYIDSDADEYETEYVDYDTPYGECYEADQKQSELPTTSEEDDLDEDENDDEVEDEDNIQFEEEKEEEKQEEQATLEEQARILDLQMRLEQALLGFDRLELENVQMMKEIEGMRLQREEDSKNIHSLIMQTALVHKSIVNFGGDADIATDIPAIPQACAKSDAPIQDTELEEESGDVAAAQGGQDSQNACVDVETQPDTLTVVEL